jgi:hypothetical protein
MAAMCHCIGEDKIQIKSEIAQHIGLLSNLLTSTFKLPERAMMDLNQGYQQLNHYGYTFRILQTQASLEVFPES